ncbi:type III-A CRISPR-associated RAMP protein Csm4 [Bryobacter aggregatus]|uniref:type III-A CRISPR-associated RAMP protein Csm4 n=1 Tax=Bryobacter aggregatus TaxID=360054 RepID=UPI0004E28478|nr:hypothetical protein [Bryobacter aggregatus]
MSALLIRLRPTGPWRIAGDTGRHDELSATFPSDRVFSAVTQAMAQLGELDAWLAATATSERPAVRFSSMFPFFGRQLYAPAPVTLWPPAQATSKMNWQAARLIPLSVIDELLAGQAFREDRWEVDGITGCLLPAGSQTPFRERTRSTAPVDRNTGVSGEAFLSGCIEFNQGVGLWLSALFSDDTAKLRWESLVKAAFRLLADTGFGGERARGWGRAEAPEFQHGSWPHLILDNAPDPETPNSAYWLLSTYVPAATDAIDWKSGYYELKRRNGRVESTAGWGAEKKSLNMVREGGVLVTATAPIGAAVDVAPEGFAHPVWRAGFAVATAIPWKAPSFQMPLPPAKVEVAAKPVAEEAPVLADIYLTDPIIVEEANIVEQPTIVEEPRYVEEDN